MESRSRRSIIFYKYLTALLSLVCTLSRLPSLIPDPSQVQPVLFGTNMWYHSRTTLHYRTAVSDPFIIFAYMLQQAMNIFSWPQPHHPFMLHNFFSLLPWPNSLTEVMPQWICFRCHHSPPFRSDTSDKKHPVIKRIGFQKLSKLIQLKELMQSLIQMQSPYARRHCSVLIRPVYGVLTTYRFYRFVLSCPCTNLYNLEWSFKPSADRTLSMSSILTSFYIFNPLT